MSGRWILGGGIASGKSRVRTLLDEQGVATIDADEVGHSVLEPDGAAFQDVASRWPEVVQRGEISRAALASIVFGDTSQLAELEAITHPHIFDRIRAMVEEIDGVVVVEMPLIGAMLGKGWRRIVVDCRDEIRLKRACDRGMSERDARARMDAQPSRPAWLAVADLVVPNHGSLADLQDTVRSLVENGKLV